MMCEEGPFQLPSGREERSGPCDEAEADSVDEASRPPARGVAASRARRRQPMMGCSGLRRAKRKGPGRRPESELGHGTCVGARPEPLLDAVFGRAWGMAVASKVHGSRDPGGCRGTTGLVAAS